MPDYVKLSPRERVSSYCHDVTPFESSICLLLFGEKEDKFDCKLDLLSGSASDILVAWEERRFYFNAFFDSLYKSYLGIVQPHLTSSFSFRFHDFAYVDFESGSGMHDWIESPENALLRKPADQGGDTYVGAITQDLSSLLCLGVYWESAPSGKKMSQKFRMTSYGPLSHTKRIEEYYKSDECLILRHALEYPS